MDELSFKRIWEDIDFFEIEIKASSNHICAQTRSYTTVELIRELSLRLSTFPDSLTDTYKWHNGEKGDDTTPYISLDICRINPKGDIVIEIFMEIDDGAPLSRHSCCFYLKTEVGLLNSFGKALLRLCEPGIGRKISL